ncbi:MAG: hypothetical protein LUC50_09725 [Ruminococcus sp.]|nr:hypothetical protein [Ruminococcus sp.]
MKMAVIPNRDDVECIWLADDKICELMKSCRCVGSDCTFRKTVAQEKQSDAAWRLRMISLSDEQQCKIAKKYYGGNMPWK